MTAPQHHGDPPAAAGRRLTQVLDLADELTDLVRVTDALAATVERATGLRRGELDALSAVDAGARHPRAVARRTGQVDDSGDATTDALVRRGLLRRTRHPAAPVRAAGAPIHAAGAAVRTAGAPVLALTEAGRVVLQQAEGLRIRLLDGVVGLLGARETAALRASLQTLVTALGPAADAGRPHPGLPG